MGFIKQIQNAASGLAAKAVSQVLKPSKSSAELAKEFSDLLGQIATQVSEVQTGEDLPLTLPGIAQSAATNKLQSAVVSHAVAAVNKDKGDDSDKKAPAAESDNKIEEKSDSNEEKDSDQVETKEEGDSDDDVEETSSKEEPSAAVTSQAAAGQKTDTDKQAVQEKVAQSDAEEAPVAEEGTEDNEIAPPPVCPTPVKPEAQQPNQAKSSKADHPAEKAFKKPENQGQIEIQPSTEEAPTLLSQADLQAVKDVELQITAAGRAMAAQTLAKSALDLQTALQPSAPQASALKPEINSVASIALQQITDIVASKGQGSATDKQSNQFLQAVSDARQARAVSASEGTKSASAVPRAQVAKAIEKVELAVQEAVRARDNKTISVRLDPPQLGQVRIDVSIKDGALHAKLTPEAQEVVMVLREKAHELQGMLRKLGLDVDKVSVSVTSEGTGTGSATGGSGGSLEGQNSSDGQHGSSLANNGSGASKGLVEGNFDPADISGFQKSVVTDHWVA